MFRKAFPAFFRRKVIGNRHVWCCPPLSRKKAGKAFLVAVCVALSCFSSCSHHDPVAEETPSTAEKTLLLFFPYSGDRNNLYNNFLQNVGDVELAMTENRGIGNRRVLVFIALSSSRAALVDIVYDDGKCRRDTLMRYGNTDMTTAEGIANILHDAKTLAPARQYALVVGSHGEGWLPAGRKAMPPTTRYFGGTSTQYQIETSALAQATAMADMHFQFILFDDCYLSTIEVAYDLRHAADYLVASTSEIMAYGMPYRFLLPHLLQATPDYEAICRKFRAFYENYQYADKPMPYGTIAVTDLRQTDDMAVLMHEINSLCTFDPSLSGDLQDLDAGHWEPTIYFDFGDYVEILCMGHDDLYSRFETQLARLVVAKAATEYIYSAAGKTTLRLNRFSGLSISDPSENEKAIATKKQTEWWKATH